MTDAELLCLHRELVAIPSLSRQESAIADFVQQTLQGWGADVVRLESTIVARAGKGPRLALNSHLDTVPANDGWTQDPWEPKQVGGKVFGLGSNDAKASVAALMCAFKSVVDSGGPCETILMLVQEEETCGKGTELALGWLGQQGLKPDGAIVGEPTELQIGIAQRGLMILELIAEGQACHAANATKLGAKNPVWQLSQDICALQSLDFGQAHPELGLTSLQPTQLKGAEAHNQVPGQAVAVLDIRSVPGLTHEEIIQLVEDSVDSKVHVRSSRLHPYQCDPKAQIAQAARQGGKEFFSSVTMSDQVFFTGIPCVKCGPGLSARSHTSDEFVMESEIIEGARFYQATINEFARRLA